MAIVNANSQMAAAAGDEATEAVMRGFKKIVRPVAHVVAAAHIALALQPLSAIAQEKAEQTYSPLAQSQMQRLHDWDAKLKAANYQAQKNDQAGPQRLQYLIQQASEQTQDLLVQQSLVLPQQKKAGPAPIYNAKTTPASLRDTLAAIQDESGTAREDLQNMRAELVHKGLSAEMLARHDAAVAEFEQRVQRLDALAARLVGNNGGLASKSAVAVNRSDLQTLGAFLAENAHHPAVNTSKDLPWHASQPYKKAPAQTRQEWNLRLGIDAPGLAKVTQVTNVGGVQFTTLPSAEEALSNADLAETEEVILTDAIKAKAVELQKDPVAIQNWVKNHIEWLPSWGSMQNANSVLQSGKGNSLDIASLTIALLRASGIPARYQFGTIELPVDRAKNLIGNFDDASSAQNMLGQGGIANVGVVSSGVIQKIKMEHVWVSAYINYAASKGSVQGGTDVSPPQHNNTNAYINAWIPLDASYKQYNYGAGVDFKDFSGISQAEALALAGNGSEANYAEGWVAKADFASLQNFLDDNSAKIQAHIKANLSDLSEDSIMGKKIIKESAPATLSGQLPYVVVTESSAVAQIPDSQKWSVSIKLFESAMDKSFGEASYTQKILLSNIGSNKISSIGVPASAADAELLQTYAAQNAESLPVYLVNQKTKLLLNDQELFTSGSRRMGSEQWWGFDIYSPTLGSVQKNFSVDSAVGDAIVFGVSSVGVTEKIVKARYHSTNPNTFTENLHHLNLGYFLRVDVSDKVLAKLNGFAYLRLPSVGMFSNPLEVTYSWGVPRIGAYKAYSIDIPRITHAISKNKGVFSNQAFVNMNMMMGMKNSSLEGSVIDEVFQWPSGLGVAAAQVLSQANKNGQKIYSITSDNLSTFLSSSGLNTTLKQQIANYASYGYIVYAPQNKVSSTYWDAEAYVAIDPQTGSGAYIIGTGANGGEGMTCETKSEPLARAIELIVTTLIILAMIAMLIALGYLVAGVLGGIVVGGGSAVAQVMAAFGVTALVFSGSAYAGKNSCPNDNKCHRGTIQAQGLDIPGNGNTKSLAWAQPMPFTVVQGLNMLEGVQNLLTPAELSSRVVYFSQAAAWISARPPAGVCAGPTFSFGPNPADKDHVKKQIRVDIKVYAGEAFSN
ncbi:transglutaminase-like domain-containing protein [Comamonas sp.]|uniref:transglutaminase-like domain-containing protein n=1 Tax=Comamonas sp. TaxID=34028 RepID=UPI0028995046|nr:transglutaminase-like domain-containing protein [Comamonas sp.]